MEPPVWHGELRLSVCGYLMLLRRPHGAGGPTHKGLSLTSSFPTTAPDYHQKYPDVAIRIWDYLKVFFFLFLLSLEVRRARALVMLCLH